jgi:hypothetical protein
MHACVHSYIHHDNYREAKGKKMPRTVVMVWKVGGASFWLSVCPRLALGRA